MTEDDISVLNGYFSWFEDALRNVDFEDEYTFDKSAQINAGDYYYIYTKYSDNPYSNFDVYYVDTDSNTLYFIHINI
ncbi:MAG: hypothetical protein LUF26_00870 [Firmicutes bacterium]|nr:hypothetical protein [Bacillota bacterium]